MAADIIQLDTTLTRLIGLRVYEVSNNINAVPYIAFNIGEQLGIVSESEYRSSIQENRRCQPERRYTVSAYCPHALVRKGRVVWSTDIDYDLDTWSFRRGDPQHNLEIVPYILGAYIDGAQYDGEALSFLLDNRMTLIFYPCRLPVKNDFV